MDKKYDLHIHTCFSDGSMEPEEIVRRRAEEGYECIAITDHDGIRGSELCFEQELDKKYEIRIIPGIEFDSEDSLGKDMHILGYYIDFSSDALSKALSQIDAWRNERNEIMLNMISRLGYDITKEDVTAVNRGRYVGKPTLARALKNKGLVPSYSYVFEEIFERPEFKNAGKNVYSSEEIIKIIHAAGGKAVLAHPMEQIRTGEGENFEAFKPRLDVLLDRMLEYGIDGIESGIHQPVSGSLNTLRDMRMHII